MNTGLLGTRQIFWILGQDTGSVCTLCEMVQSLMCVCFIAWQKAFYRVNWTKLMQTLKRICIDWRERKLISKSQIEQRLNYDWSEGRQEVWSLEEELDKDAICHQLCSTCTANALPRELWMGLETSTSEGKLFKLWNMQMISKSEGKLFKLWNMQMTLC